MTSGFKLCICLQQTTPILLLFSKTSIGRLSQEGSTVISLFKVTIYLPVAALNPEFIPSAKPRFLLFKTYLTGFKKDLIISTDESVEALSIMIISKFLYWVLSKEAIHGLRKRSPFQLRTRIETRGDVIAL